MNIYDNIMTRKQNIELIIKEDGIMKKKLLVTAMVAMMAASSLAGCGSQAPAESAAAGTGTTASAENAGGDSAKAEDNGEVVELEFWGWWSSEARKPHIETMVNGFNESQSKYHVTYVDIPFGDIFTKNIAQIAAGSPCDIMANSLEEVRFRAGQGQVEALDDYLTEDVSGGFYDQYLDACKGDDGKTYALPLSVDTRAIYYNKDHFEEAGILAEDIQTWADLEDAARKLDKKNGNDWERIGFIPVLGNGGVDTWVINANGGQGWFDLNTFEAKVNTETNKEAFAWVKKQIDVYGQDKYNELSAVFNSGMQDPFASGVMSMLVHTSAYQSSLKQNAPDLNYGVIKLPEFKEGTGHVANGGGFVLEIPKGAKCPEGSYEFIKYVTGKETQDFLATNIGDFSARNDFDDTTEFFKNPINVELAKCLEETITIIVPNEIKGYQDVVNPLIEEGTLGIKSTDAALDNAQKAFEDFISNNR